MPGPSPVFVPRVVAAFLDARPKVTVSLQTRSSQLVKEWIAARHFDVGLAELPVDDLGIEVETLSLNCVCGMALDHRLAQEQRVTPRDLDGLPFISLNRDHMTYFRLERAFDPPIPFDIGILYPAWRPRSRLAEEFVAALRDNLARHIAL